jgi:hypothetical protein
LPPKSAAPAIASWIGCRFGWLKLEAEGLVGKEWARKRFPNKREREEKKHDGCEKLFLR